jgi:hypothetical protein
MQKSPLGIATGLLVASLAFAGCKDGGADCVVTSDPGVCVLDPGVGLTKPTTNPDPVATDCTGLGEECLLPYPSSAFLRVDESTPSGRRVAAPPSLEGLDLDLAELERADGFSRVTPILTYLPGGVSAEGLPSIRDRVAAYSLSTADDSPIFVVNADATSARYGARVPFFAEAFESGDAPEESLLVVTPLEPLDPGARYAVVVTSRVLDRCGDPSVPGATTRALLANERPEGELGARWDVTRDLRYLAEAELGLAPCEIVQLWDFWTRSDEDLTRDLLSMRETALEWLAVESTDPVITELTTADDGSTRIEFTYSGPSFRHTPSSGFTRDEEGHPMIVREETLHGIVILPADATQAEPVVPITLGHGFGMDAAQMCTLAKNPVLGRGVYALGCFDFELHGHRGDGAASVLDLLDPSSLASLSSLFQQGAIDELIFSDALGALASDPELEGRLDTSYRLYTGVSMGGFIGSLATSIDDAIDASVLNVAGGGIIHLVRHSTLFEGMGVRDIARGFVESTGGVTGLPMDLEAELIIAMSQFAIDEADPVNWGSHLVTDRLVLGEPPVLLQESMGDGVVPNFNTELLARAGSFPLVAPYHTEVPGLEVVDSPTQGAPHYGLTQFAVSHIGFLAHLAFSDARLQAQLFAFLDSVLDEDPDNDGDIRFP